MSVSCVFEWVRALRGFGRSVDSGNHSIAVSFTSANTLQLISDGLKVSDAFFAQYQQMPVPPGGATIKRAWIKEFLAEKPVKSPRKQAR